MSRRPACRLRAHIWRPVRGGRYERCATCHGYFPCKQRRCGHVDCHWIRGEPLPPRTAWAMAMLHLTLDTSTLVPWSR